MASPRLPPGEQVNFSSGSPVEGNVPELIEVAGFYFAFQNEARRRAMGWVYSDFGGDGCG